MSTHNCVVLLAEDQTTSEVVESGIIGKKLVVVDEFDMEIV